MPELTQDVITRACIVCALWSTTDDAGNPLDDTYGPDDLAPECTAAFAQHCADFVTTHVADCQEWQERFGLEQLGHALWLTAQRHGAGFWDRGAGELGDRLTEAAHTSGFAGADLYVGDDGWLYL